MHARGNNSVMETCNDESHNVSVLLCGGVPSLWQLVRNVATEAIYPHLSRSRHFLLKPKFSTEG